MHIPRVSTDRGEAEDHMQVLASACEEKVHHILGGWWSAWMFPLHDRDELTHNFTLLVSVKEIADHSYRSKVKILKSLLSDFCNHFQVR